MGWGGRRKGEGGGGGEGEDVVGGGGRVGGGGWRRRRRRRKGGGRGGVGKRRRHCRSRRDTMNFKYVRVQFCSNFSPIKPTTEQLQRSGRDRTGLTDLTCSDLQR